MSSAEERRPGETRGLRNGRGNLLASRDNPVFTQMRRNQRGRQEFFTESTNTSYIPSPSPVRAAPLAKPRRAQNSRSRTSNGAHKAVHEDKENEPGQSTPAPQDQSSRSRASSTKRSPVHVSAAGSPVPTARAPGREITRTPSPSRKRDERPDLVSPASFISESSEPPYALPEIYRRIEDEESIAGASDVSSSAKGSTEHSRIKRLSLSPSGERSPSARRVSPLLLAQEVEGQTDTTALPSPPHLSPRSGASSPFEETVQTDPEMLARDERRVKEAIASDTRPFAKARKVRGNLTLENLRRQETGQDLKAENESQSSSNGKGQELGVNVPIGWGSKARKDRRWLENITKGRQPVTAEPATTIANGANGLQEPGKATDSVKDWLQGASASPIVEVNEPEDAPQGDDVPEPLRERRSFEKAKLWESQRLKDTLAPPKTTSPLSTLRERSIERLEKSAVATSRLGALGDRRTLQKLARKSSGGISTLSSPTSESAPMVQSDERVTADVHLLRANSEFDTANRGTSEVSNTVTSSAQITKPEGPVSPEVAKQLAFAAATQSKQDSRDLLRRFARATSSSPAGAGRTSHAGPPRSDSNDKKQPSPLSLEAGATSVQAVSAYDSERKSHPSLILQPTLNLKQKPITTASDEPALMMTTVDANRYNQIEPKAPTEKSESAEGKEPENQKDDDDFVHIGSKAEIVEEIVQLVAETPQVAPKGPLLSTPKVMGAWVDTPIASAKKLGMIPEDMSDPEAEYDQDSLLEAAKIVLGKDKGEKIGSRLQDRSSRDLEALAETAPDLPRSALAAIIDHAKRKNKGEEGAEGDETLQLDDTTIESLEKLLVKDEGAPADGQEKAATTSKAASADRIKPESNPAKKSTNTKSAADTSRELSTGRPDSSKLTGGAGRPNSTSKPSLTISIDDSPKSKKTKKSVSVVPPEEICDQAGEFHDFIWPCEACRKRAKYAHTQHPETETIGVVQWQTIQIPRLWYYPSPQHRLPRPTRLTWFACIILACYIAEKITASYYTPPFYAWEMKGYGVDYNMVRPPWVIPKLIWRGPAGQVVRWIWSTLVVTFEWILWAFGIEMPTPAPPLPTPDVMPKYYKVYYPPGYDEDSPDCGPDKWIRVPYIPK